VKKDGQVMARGQLRILLGCVLCAACAEPESRPEAGFGIDTVGSVVRVWNAEARDVDTLIADLSIGRMGGTGPAMPDEFGQVASVTIDARGEIFVADWQAREVRVFSSQGRFSRAFGRSGEGPGEFSTLYSLGWLGDTLLVLDPGNARVSVLDRSGQSLNTWRWIPLTGGLDVVRFYPTAPRETYILGLSRVPGSGGMTYIRLTPSGAADTLDNTIPEDLPGTMLRCPREDGAISFFEIPFAGQYLTAPAPGGQRAVAWSADYRIAFLNAAGDTLRVVEREYTPVPISDEQWEEEIAEYREFREQWPGARCDPAGMDRPSYRASLQGIFFDQDGRLVTEVTVAQGSRYDFFDAEGVARQSVLLPPRDTRVSPYFRGNRIVQVAVDSLGIQRVEVFTRPLHE
jgi:hypothetical protein